MLTAHPCALLFGLQSAKKISSRNSSKIVAARQVGQKYAGPRGTAGLRTAGPWAPLDASQSPEFAEFGRFSRSLFVHFHVPWWYAALRIGSPSQDAALPKFLAPPLGLIRRYRRLKFSTLRPKYLEKFRKKTPISPGKSFWRRVSASWSSIFSGVLFALLGRPSFRNLGFHGALSLKKSPVEMKKLPLRNSGIPRLKSTPPS